MTTLRIYLDRRAVAANQPAPLKVAITKHTKTAMLPLEIKVLPSQWDAQRQIVVKHPKKAQLNAYITNRLARINDILRQLVVDEIAPTLNATQLKNRIKSILDPDTTPDGATLGDVYNACTEKKRKATSQKYASMLASILRYDKDAIRRPLITLDTRWLDGWQESMSNLSHNTRCSYTMFFYGLINYALDNEIIQRSPIKRVRLKMVATRKRSLSAEQLRTLFSISSDSRRIQAAIDIYKLIFLLIGINAQDLLSLTDDALQDGRIEYDRLKTNRHYSIKVLPAAMDIINRYRGNGMLVDWHRWGGKAVNAINAYCSLNKAIQMRAAEYGLPNDITTYWMRHSWATIAVQLDIPKDVIALGLGHGGNTVTDIYINPDLRKVDDANEAVFAYVFAKKT